MIGRQIFVKMFEARLIQGSLLKRVLETVKDLLNFATFDCNDKGIQLQAMDNSHVSLMSVNMRADGFDVFLCNKFIRMGVDLAEMSKILKYATNKDIITMKVEDESETITFTFESPNKRKVTPIRTMKMNMKSTNFEQEPLGIPDINYSAVIKMPSDELQRVVRELSEFGNSLVINCAKEGEVKFAAAGDNGTGNIRLRSDGREEEAVTIKVQEPVIMTFACNYLNMFTKASRFGKPGLPPHVS